MHAILFESSIISGKSFLAQQYRGKIMWCNNTAWIIMLQPANWTIQTFLSFIVYVCNCHYFGCYKQDVIICYVFFVRIWLVFCMIVFLFLFFVFSIQRIMLNQRNKLNIFEVNVIEGITFTYNQPLILSCWCYIDIWFKIWKHDNKGRKW